MWASEILIESILSDSNNLLIEVWDNVLYVWKKKGAPKFVSTLGLKFNNKLYYRYEDYKQLSKKYHPDTTSSKSARVLSGDIQSSINHNKEYLQSRDRGFIKRNFIQFFSQFNKTLSIKNVSLRSVDARQLLCRLEQHARMVFHSTLSGGTGEFASLLRDFFTTKGSNEYCEIYNQRGKTNYKTRSNSNQRKEIVDKLYKFGREVEKSMSNNRVRFWNKIGVKPKSKKNNTTLYGESSRANQLRLRRTYGDVFRMSVGGPIDIRPLKA